MRLAQMDAVLAGHVARGDVLGLTWLVARGSDAHVGYAGTAAPDTIFRISSMTKPVVAVAALMLVERCAIRLDEPVDRLLPELADRQVMRDPAGSIDDTVPADRPITVRDLLTFRMGLGMDFAAPWPQPPLEAMAALDRGAGPPAPARAPAPDEWMRRLRTLPLAHHPGTRWMYDTSADVLGVLVARAAGQPLDAFLREQIFDPLGMRDTGFSVPADALHRFGPRHVTDPETGARQVYDAVDGQWSRPPAFPAGGDGLVSTVDDFAAFASMLRAGGVHGGHRLLARPTIEAMTTNQLPVESLAVAGPSPQRISPACS